MYIRWRHTKCRNINLVILYQTYKKSPVFIGTAIIWQYKDALFEYKLLLKQGCFQNNDYIMNVNVLRRTWTRIRRAIFCLRQRQNTDAASNLRTVSEQSWLRQLLSTFWALLANVLLWWELWKDHSEIIHLFLHTLTRGTLILLLHIYTGNGS